MIDYLDLLTPEQRQAVEYVSGPSLILAGAGSGKTRVLTSKITYLISEKKIDPFNILAITFTNKAAREMKERVEKNCPDKTPWMMTFHSFCARLLRIEGEAVGLTKNFVIYDEDDSISAIKEAVKTLNQNITFKPKSIKETISQAKNENINEFEYVNFARGFYQETVSNVYLLYQKILRENNAVDFDDLLLLTNKLFSTHPEVAEKYQKRFKYVLIDEYQDTNTSQYILSKTLAKKWGNITIVGDAAQSIYSWRGADYHNLMNFKEDFPASKIFNLEENFRSTQEILDAANLIIKQNTSHPVLHLYTKQGSGEKIQAFMCEDEKEEADSVLLLARGRLRILEKTKPATGSSIAILYRTNAQSRVLEESLLKAGMPYKLFGGVKFYERKEIKDLISYLRLIANPKDSVAKTRIDKIGKTRAKKFEEFRLNLETLYAATKQKEVVTLDLLEEVIKVTEYLSFFDPEDEEDISRLENIKELKTVAQQFPDLNEFLENIALLEGSRTNNNRIDMFNSETLENPIILMTLHSAKGLEFDTVFMVGMEEGIFPHQRSFLDNAQMEEERRLCYVGITRARRKLYFTYAKSRTFLGSYSANEKSRFLETILKKME
jgi:DNA helicase II / ATP-dependent DNA helicase PcrA